jgi:hypothetical protein
MQAPIFVGAGTFALLTLEAIKFLYRKFGQDPDYTFPSIFYELLIPFFTAVWGLLFSLVPELGFPQLPPEQILSLPVLFQWALAIVIEIVFYYNGIKPIKDDIRIRNAG